MGELDGGCEALPSSDASRRSWEALHLRGHFPPTHGVALVEQSAVGRRARGLLAQQPSGQKLVEELR